mmetsp:Transcript_24458/g.37927  ORF Transcript_24458/g.37927 Transcript_24458/m.37927 type:complete len:117 (+) Transcript_24458:16-366(+)
MALYCYNYIYFRSMHHAQNKRQLKLLSKLTPETALSEEYTLSEEEPTKQRMKIADDFANRSIMEPLAETPFFQETIHEEVIDLWESPLLSEAAEHRTASLELPLLKSLGSLPDEED